MTPTPLVDVAELAAVISAGTAVAAGRPRSDVSAVSLTNSAPVAPAPAPTGPPTLLDVRWTLGGPSAIEAYNAAHIPGAHFVDLDRELAAPAGPSGRHPLPDATDFGAAMRRCGVSASRPVVVYDAAGGLSAARAWWLLRYFGHPDVRLLDGGFAAWTAAGHAVEPAPRGSVASAPAGSRSGEPGAEVTVGTDEVAPGAGGPPGADRVDPAAAGDFQPEAGAMPVLGVDEVLDVARRGVLLDARAAERYRGEVEPIDPVAGHIPGAHNAPTTGNLDASGRLLPPAALRARFEAIMEIPAAPTPALPLVAVYCGSGVTAAHEVLALEVAGIPAALYPGSWSEWIVDPSRPVATGAQAW